MAKGYWIASLNIKDQAAYDEYKDVMRRRLGLHGGKFLVRGGPYEDILGQSRHHNVVIEFPDARGRARLLSFARPTRTRCNICNAAATSIS